MMRRHRRLDERATESHGKQFVPDRQPPNKPQESVVGHDHRSGPFVPREPDPKPAASTTVREPRSSGKSGFSRGVFLAGWIAGVAGFPAGMPPGYAASHEKSGSSIERSGDLCRLNAWYGPHGARQPTGERKMGKGNNSQKNDKKNLKPKQDKAKPATKK